MKHISYPKIGQFREVVKAVQLHSSYVGKDEEGNAIYDNSKTKPVIRFTGTVKLHGTNASICFNPIEGIYIQSRSNVISIEKDNAGFASYVTKHKDYFESYLKSIHYSLNLKNSETVVVYGEWAGKSIQKGVAISEIEKSFFTFGLKVCPEEKDSYWIDGYRFSIPERNIYSIESFPTFTIEIDFNKPELVQNKLIEITELVEKKCPVAKEFGVEGIGEGVVWSGRLGENSYRFKVKGEKHSVTKVKKLASVNVEKLESIDKFVEYCVTESRVDQAIKEVFGEEEITKQKTSDFLRWIANDIISEEQDTLVENDLCWKDVASKVSGVARSMFFKKIDL